MDQFKCHTKTVAKKFKSNYTITSKLSLIVETIIDDSEDSSSDSEDSYEELNDQEREIMSYLDKINV